jgi:glycosyltransferase involved in cell wall biosynthesis
LARLLIVSTNYAPEVTGTGPYVAEVAQHLAAAGHSVDVIAGLPHYPEWRLGRGVPRRLRWTTVEGAVRVHRRAHYVPSRPSAAGRAALEATFLLQGMIGVPSDIDAVIGIVPSLADAVLARVIASQRAVPYALVFQDLMGQAAAQSGSAGASVARATRHAEAWALRRSQLAGIISPSFAPYLESVGMRADRLVTLANWARPREARTSREVIRGRMGWRDELVVVHAGNMGMKQGLEQVVEAASIACSTGARMRFVLFGDGNQRAHIASLAAGLSSLEIKPLLPESELADVLAAADVLLISERSSLRDMSLPSKLTTYLWAGRPVVAAVPPAGVTAAEVTRSGGGIVVPAGEPDALVEELLGLADDEVRREKLSAAGRSFARQEFDQAAGLARYLAFVDRLLSYSSRSCA